MRIVVAMAADTGRGEFCAIQIACVTGVAFDFAMLALEREPGFAIVIEFRALPLCRGVACRTFLAIAALVGVLDAMASGAIARDVLIAFAHVAGRAGHLLVLLLERKSGLAVIKRLLLVPCLLTVAIGTFLAETAFMRVVLLVAPDAR